VYSGDGDIPGSIDPDPSSSSTSECFTVTPIKPTLTTSASCSASPCVIGSTLSDTSSLTGTAKQPGTNGIGAATAWTSSVAGSIDATNQAAAGGSIAWTLYGPSSTGGAQCTTTISGAPSGTPVGVSGDRPLNGDGTSYGPVTYTTNHSGDKVGPYEFAATYGGNSPNTSAADAVTCDTSGTNGEQVTVIGSASSASAQGWLPNDRITLSSTAGTTLSGNLTVTLYYGALASGSTLANCTLATGAVQKYQETWSSAAGADHPAISGTGPITVNTHNTTFYVGTNPNDGTAGGPDTDATHSYIWLIHYSDNTLTSPHDRCETSTVTHNDG
jgi:hypothetical protein